MIFADIFLWFWVIYYITYFIIFVYYIFFKGEDFSYIRMNDYQDDEDANEMISRIGL